MDTVPLSRDHEGAITARIVEVATRNVAEEYIPHSEEPIRVASYAPLPTHGTSFVDHVNGSETEMTDALESMPVSFPCGQTLYNEEMMCQSLHQQNSFNPNVHATNETPKEVLQVTLNNTNVRRDDNTKVNLAPSTKDLPSSAETVPCTDKPAEEEAPRVSDVANGPPKSHKIPVSGLPLIFSEETYPCDDLSRKEVGSAYSLGETSDVDRLVSHSLLSPNSPPKRLSSSRLTGERMENKFFTMPSSHYFSCEGDVSDIEADIEESQLSLSQLQVCETPASAIAGLKCVTSIRSSSSFPPGASAFFEDELPAPDDLDVSIHNTESDAAAISVLAAAPEEASEEQSSGSGARESANTEDSGRSRRRYRPRGRRRRRGGKPALYQATEAEAHFMFELAKTVLTKGGGNNSNSVFTQTASSDSQTGPHRVLQLCAFEIGLFALGLHNQTSANWLSRTYSSHVSWISGQAMEIGHRAIEILLEHWEGNLTPSEVASIADRASKSSDRAMVHAAANLALSCLHMATTLNPGEIQRALSQCRDEDPQLLDQACQAVESAARGGGVYPEVLFDVAKHWFHLHEKNHLSSSTSRPAKSETRSRSSLGRSTQSMSSSNHSPPLSPFVSQTPQFTIPLSYSAIPPPLYTTPEQYVQQQMHHQVHQMMGHYPAYLPPNSSGYRCGSQAHSYAFSRTCTQFSLSGAYAGLTPPPYQSTSVTASTSQYVNRLTTTQQGAQASYHLNSAYRVGMLALEFLSRRTSDDRPNVKFSRNPTCSEEIKWLCTLSAKLGSSHLQRFCVAALNAVVSPFVLHELALEAARHMARSNPAQLAANLRSPTISPLVQKSLTMYAQCIHYNLINISQNEYKEFVELLRHARGAFCMASGGMTQFNELLQSIRRGHSKKKELWQMIMTGLAKA